MLTQEKTIKELGKDIQQLCSELSKIKGLLQESTGQDRYNLDLIYRATKAELVETQSRLQKLNRVKKQHRRKPKDGPSGRYYWFFVAAKEYLPQKVIKAVEDLAVDKITEHLKDLKL